MKILSTPLRSILLLTLLAPLLRAELLVVIGGSGGSYDGLLYRYDDSTGAQRPSFQAINEGWFGLCRGLTGDGYVIGNTLGQGDLYGVDPQGHLVRGPLWIGPDSPGAITFGPNGYLYGVGAVTSGNESGIIRFDSRSGARLGDFVEGGAGGIDWRSKLAFGPDGNLYATSNLGIVRFRGDTGAFINVFVPLGSGGLSDPKAILFGPDGHLYVASGAGNSVKRYHGASGASLGDFIAAGTGGLNNPMDLAYGPDGRLYVASYGSKQVLRFDATSGAFHSVFITTAEGPRLIVFTRAPGAGETVWFDDALPAGAAGSATGGDSWNWVSGPSSPGGQDGPLFGTKAHRSASIDGPGVHEHFFNFAQPFPINAGDILFAYVFVPAGDEPHEIMLSWKDETNWEHRAFWGYNVITAGTYGTASRRDMGRLTREYLGRWIRLEVPASLVGLEGRSVRGMAFSLVGGSATWDRVGKVSGESIISSPPTPPEPPVTPPATGTTTTWFEDAFPQGASPSSTGGAWTWAASTPAPNTGSMALYSTLAAGRHEQGFNFAWSPLALGNDDSFYIDVYLDPANPPRELVLSFCSNNWEHRAYWGENLMRYAADGTAAQRRIGDLPPAGQWTRLVVPASAVGLQGHAVKGLSLTLYDGRAVFDQAGKVTP